MWLKIELIDEKIKTIGTVDMEVSIQRVIKFNEFATPNF